MIGTLRIYCELLGAEELFSDPLVAFMAGFREVLEGLGWRGSLEVVLKVLLPSEGDAVDEALWDRLGGSGRQALAADRIWLWGQLVDRQRVYLNTGTHEAVFSGWRRLLAQMAAAGVVPEGLFFDLEPDRWVLEVLSDSWVRGAGEVLGEARLLSHRRSALEIGEAVRGLMAQTGVPVLAACAPLTLFGRWVPWAERVVGTPLVCEERGPIWPELTCMNYVSFGLPTLGGVGAARAWARSARIGGWVARRHVAWARAQGVVPSVICGTNCVGILGDEPSYPDAASMRGLLLATAAAKPNALEVFNLTGIVYGPGGVDAEFRVDEGRWRAWAAVLGEALTAG